MTSYRMGDMPYYVFETHLNCENGPGGREQHVFNMWIVEDYTVIRIETDTEILYSTVDYVYDYVEYIEGESPKKPFIGNYPNEAA